MNRQDFDALKRVHFVGLGGIGISALAKYCLHFGKAVSGSDLAENPSLEELRNLGAQVFIGHHKENLPTDADLVVYSAAIQKDNPELAQAGLLNIPTIGQFELIGAISEGKKLIAIAGTNGKSTTTAMVGAIFEQANLDPTVFLGSKVKAWGGNVRVGESRYFIVEADEYYRKFLALKPDCAVLTNIEADHLDYFKDLSDVQDAFAQFIEKVAPSGTVIFNADDPGCKNLAQKKKFENAFFYGNSGDRVKLISVKTEQNAQILDVSIDGKMFSFEILLPGEINAQNALAAISASVNFGIEPEIINVALKNFPGIWRRFERRGSRGNTLIISDYAHHPTALLATMKAARSFYPGKKILLAFQPHQYRRTRLLFNQFVEALISADPEMLVMLEVFDVAGREDNDKSIGSRQLLEKVSEELSRVFFVENIEEAEKLILAEISNYDIVIVMGAGNIDNLADRLVA